MAKNKKSAGVGIAILGAVAAAFVAIPSGDKVAEGDHSAAIKAADPPAITETIGQSADEPDTAQQEPEQTADPTTGTGDTSNNGAAAQETTEDPQSTVTPEGPEQEQPNQEEPVQQEPQQPTERTVYITPTGSKYHREHCRTIKGDKTAISLSDAIARGYEACGVCGG